MKQTCSIALITYNGEKYLARQLETLAEQTRLPDELVVCDDGSTDKTVEILEDFAKTAPFPVRIYRNEENLGCGLNFRKAFFLCEKDVVFFCDQDDVWFPEKIVSGMAVFENEPTVGMVLMNDLWTDADEKPILNGDKLKYLRKWINKENSFHSLLRASKYGWSAHNMACRRVLFDTLFTGNLPRYAEFFDQWVFRILGASCDVRILLEPTMLFRRHGGNSTSHSRKSKNLLRLALRALRRHIDLSRILEKSETFQQAVDFLMLKEVKVGEKDEMKEEGGFYPEVVAIYQQGARHFACRIRAIENPWGRVVWIPSEFFKGNYHRFSRGFRDVVMDFLMWPYSMKSEEK